MFDLLLLIIIANSAPVVARNLLRDRLQAPIDGGRRFFDSRPLLGRSKTWRGLAVACAACGIAAPLIGLSIWTGVAAGALSMSGDLLASFAKRRLGLKSGEQSVLLDALPEALLPALGLKRSFALSWIELVFVALLFAVIVRFASPLLYRLKLRRRPW